MPAASESPSSSSGASIGVSGGLSAASGLGSGNSNGNGIGSASVNPSYTSNPTTHQRVRPSSGSIAPSSSLSTLNPNAGGFQPGALSALGEVEHEALMTPIATSFDGTMASPSQAQSQAHHLQQQIQNVNPFNVFGSPVQTPQHQIGNHHNFAAQSPQEWANYHNVFNAGIGNPNNSATSPGGADSGNQGAPGLAGLSDLTNNPALAAAALSMSPIQAQLAMLQSMQQQQQMVAAGYPATTQQQQVLALQQQQLQLQALLAAQAQAQLAAATQQQQQQTNSNNNTNNGGGSNLPPRFAQSQSQPDLASLAAGLSGSSSNIGRGGGFMAEQLALHAQYEALRQQQQDLLQRQFQAVQLGQQAQAMSPQQGGGNANLPSNSSPVANRGQQKGTQNISGQQQRRGASHSVSVAGQTSSGHMGQFGSMGQFALPAQGGTGIAATAGLPKGHGRRHSVNVAKRDPNLNTSFSFPAGSTNPTQQQQAGQMGIGATAFVNAMTDLNLDNDPAENVPAGRTYGHGRRESRGSIGSLAGWGSSRFTHSLIHFLDLFLLHHERDTEKRILLFSQWLQTPTSSLNLPYPSHKRT